VTAEKKKSEGKKRGSLRGGRRGDRRVHPPKKGCLREEEGGSRLAVGDYITTVGNGEGEHGRVLDTWVG